MCRVINYTGRAGKGREKERREEKIKGEREER